MRRIISICVSLFVLLVLAPMLPHAADRGDPRLVDVTTMRPALCGPLKLVEMGTEGLGETIMLEGDAAWSENLKVRIYYNPTARTMSFVEIMGDTACIIGDGANITPAKAGQPL